MLGVWVNCYCFLQVYTDELIWQKTGNLSESDKIFSKIWRGLEGLLEDDLLTRFLR